MGGLFVECVVGWLASIAGQEMVSLQVLLSSHAHVSRVCIQDTIITCKTTLRK